MNRKSKLVAFILSFIPGLGQLYLGSTQRAILFFGSLLGSIFAVTGTSLLFNTEAFMGILGFLIPIIWFISMADCLNLVDQLHRIDTNASAEDQEQQRARIYAVAGDNHKMITIALSVIPGAGHMYLGLLKQGALFMTVFFADLILTGWLEMPILGFILPVIWFYSIFEAYHLMEDNLVNVNAERINLGEWLSRRPLWVGWTLIGFGVLIIVSKIAAPLLLPILSPHVTAYLQTGLVALVLIGGGIKLIMGNKTVREEIEDKEAVI